MHQGYPSKINTSFSKYETTERLVQIHECQLKIDCDKRDGREKCAHEEKSFRANKKRKSVFLLATAYRSSVF
jgi:hypothetical protein